MRRNIVVIIALLILVGWGFYDYNNKNLQQTGTVNEQQNYVDVVVGTKKGNKAADFELLNLNGQSVNLSDFAGKKVILNFWATWCPPCRAEMPHMEKFYKDHGEDVEILAVNLTNTEKKESDVRTFVEDFGLSFTIVLDTEGNVTDLYKVFAYPTTYIIDTQGIIQEIFLGPIDYNIMKQATTKIN